MFTKISHATHPALAWPTKILSSRAEWYAGVIIKIRYDKSNHTRSCDKCQYLVFFDYEDSPERTIGSASTTRTRSGG